MANNTLSITGTFLHATAVEAVGANNYLKRSFYVDITTNPQYPNTPEFQLGGDKTVLVDNLKKGDEITVTFNLDGRKYRSKSTNKEGVITNLSVWKVEVIQRQSAAAPRPAAPQAAATVPANRMPAGAGTAPFDNFQDDGNGDLPF